MAQAFPREYREKARDLRAKGWTLEAIANELGTGMSTVSPWVKDVSTPELESLKQQRWAQARGRGTGKCGEAFRLKRQAAFNLGLADVLTPHDALVLGLYWGEGNKRARAHGKASTPSWCVTNMEFSVLQHCLAWACRHGVDKCDFRVEVYAHKSNVVTDGEITEHWARLGVDLGQVRVYRKFPGDTSVRAARSPYGVCRLAVGRKGVYVFCRLLGQLYQLTGVLHSAALVAGIEVPMTQ
jgi:hypothetical protein